MPYIPHTDEDIEEMLSQIGVESIEELFSSIPEKIRQTHEPALPESLSEQDVIRAVTGLAERNLDCSRLLCFLGGGTYHHYIPPAVPHLLSRSEFYTSYTPYQAEFSQGTLQAMFEFQTMVCELFGMEVANASMYDGAQAAAEATLMALRIRPKNKTGKILVASSLNPLYKRTVETYLARLDRDVEEVEFYPSGRLDLDRLRKDASDAVAIMVQHPNYFGVLERMDEIGEICKESEPVLITVTSEPLAMGMLEPPGSFGADIVAAEGQSLGIPMGFGGPHLGLFACRWEDKRKMPGRLAGMTTDRDGRQGFVLTLATREQHIRRGKATSNICTNQGLMALAAAIYMSLTGPEGLEEIARTNRANCEYLKQRLEEEGAGKLAFASPTFNEFVLDLSQDPGPVIEKMLEKGHLAGIPLKEKFPELDTHLLITATEMLCKDDLDRFARDLKMSLAE
ncbi:MAG: aminomethyl-transferring glycine dehydrogenase subunit GcvPA [bacterium]